MLLYEMKFLVPNYSCLQNPWLRGYHPPIPVLSVLCPQLNLLNPPPKKKFLGTPLITVTSQVLICEMPHQALSSIRLVSLHGKLLNTFLRTQKFCRWPMKMVLTPAEAQVPSQYSLCKTCDYQINSTALFYSTLTVPYHLSFHQYSILICILGLVQ